MVKLPEARREREILYFLSLAPLLDLTPLLGLAPPVRLQILISVPVRVSAQRLGNESSGANYHFSATFAAHQRRRCKIAISLFTLSPTICYLWFVQFGLYNVPIARPCAPSDISQFPKIHYDVHNLLYSFSFLWSLILRFLVMGSSLGL